ncbi:DUF1294 domain-containing protein [Sporosarcina sp. HYO08]|uniref:DUF1294 domain-containing protein n=1 Tax=Sporosarcina sp. HYO08 TaxID=1759557 RepID=UPI001C12B11F|nr:DUF1294 domain-containing protein [Sporosarcina sp. HYO08]
MQTVFLWWMAAMSLWAFAAMGIDKRQAKMRQRRIPEKNLWLLGLLGGGIGAYLGMQIFKHKTRHTSFRIGFLLLALTYGIVVLYLLGIRLPGMITI